VEVRRFLTGFEQDLQAEADAEKWDAAMDGVNQRRAEMLFVEGANECGDVANAGKKQGFGIRKGSGRAGAQRVRSETLQGALDGRNITRAVVEDGDLHRSPFVLGKTWRKRLSRETAKRSARAKALKIASI
jgi:hypothetical protein